MAVSGLANWWFVWRHQTGVEALEDKPLKQQILWVFFDFILAVNGTKMTEDQTGFNESIIESENKEAKLVVYNILADSFLKYRPFGSLNGHTFLFVLNDFQNYFLPTNKVMALSQSRGARLFCYTQNFL